MSISSLGVGSGLPLNELLDGLRSTRQAHLDAITDRQKKAESRVSGYGQLKNELELFSKAALALRENALNAVKATTTGSDFTATANAGAVNSQYEIIVTSLAKAQSLVTQGTSTRNTNIGSGGVIELTIDGQTKSVDLTGKGSSLNDIVSAINSDTSLGVAASVINNGSDQPYQLVLTSRKTGVDAAVTNIEVTGNDELQALMGFGSAGSTVNETAAQNAQATINGIAITSQSNTLNSTIDNVTITLTGQSGTSGTLAVEQDNAAITASIENFVNTYNDVHKKIKQLTSYDAATNKGAALFGDSLPRLIQTRMAGILNTSVSNNAYANLNSIGIKTGTDGLLTIDKTKLADAITNDITGVKNLFGGDSGVSKTSTDVAATFLDSTDGMLATSTEGANRSIKSIKAEFERASARIDAEMELMRKSFVAMDSLVSQMNSMSTQLTQQLSALTNNNGKN